MRSRQPTPGGFAQALAVGLEQVNGEPLRPEKLGDAVDRGLERVGERELRDRLADHRDESPAALQFDRLLMRPLARAQRVRRPRGKRRQRVEHIVGRHRRLLEPELEDPDLWLPELQDPGAGCDRERHPAGKGSGDLGRIGIVDAEQARRAWPQVVVEPPDDGAAGVGRLGRQPGDLLGGAPLLETRGERVAAEAQEVGGAERLPVAVPVDPGECDSRVLRSQLGERALL